MTTSDTLLQEIEREVNSAIYCGDEDDTDVSGATDRIMEIVTREKQKAVEEFVKRFQEFDPSQIFIPDYPDIDKRDVLVKAKFILILSEMFPRPTDGE